MLNVEIVYDHAACLARTKALLEQVDSLLTVQRHLYVAT